MAGLCESLRQLSTGSEVDWRTFLAGQAGIITAVVRSLIGGDQTLVDEAVQATYVALFRQAPRFRPQGRDPEAGAQAWIIRIAAGCTAQVQRDVVRRRRRERPLDGDREPAVAEPDPSDPERLASLDLRHLGRGRRDRARALHLAAKTAS